MPWQHQHAQPRRQLDAACGQLHAEPVLGPAAHDVGFAALVPRSLSDVVQLRQIVEASEAAEAHKRHERQRLDALLGWCEATGCRRRPLLEYFGDEPRDACGNCDGCLEPVSTWDGLEAAQMLLSAVYRTGQRFGAAHIVDVLLGKLTDKVQQHGHGEPRGDTQLNIKSEIEGQPEQQHARQ